MVIISLAFFNKKLKRIFLTDNARRPTDENEQIPIALGVNTKASNYYFFKDVVFMNKSPLTEERSEQLK